MMIICESGSTKADWAIIKSEDDIAYTESVGINPLFHDANFISSELKKNELLYSNKEQITEVYYYGTSCSAEVRNKIVREGLANIFTNAKIVVAHDLDGAVHAVVKVGSPAIVNILGTGSNSCYYDGQNIVQQIGGNGFIISDEASGAYFGKLLIGDYLNELLPKNMYQYLKEDLGLTRDDLLDKIYKQPNANVYLAQFTKVFTQFSKEEYVQKNLKEGFNIFCRKHICRFPHYELMPSHFIGSISLYFRDLLELVCKENSVKFGNVIQRPLDGLIDYHFHQK